MTQVPSDKPTPPSREPAVGQAGSRIEAALKGITRDLNTAGSVTGRMHSRYIEERNDLPHFVSLSRKLGDALIENAEAQVTRAQNNLEEIKHWVENMQAEAQQKWEE